MILRKMIKTPYLLLSLIYLMSSLPLSWANSACEKTLTTTLPSQISLLRKLKAQLSRYLHLQMNEQLAYQGQTWPEDLRSEKREQFQKSQELFKQITLRLNEQLVALAEKILQDQGIKSQKILRGPDQNLQLQINLENPISSHRQPIPSPFAWRLVKILKSIHPKRLQWCLDFFTCSKDAMDGYYLPNSTILANSDLDFLLSPPKAGNRRVTSTTLRHEIRHYLGDAKRHLHRPSIYHFTFSGLDAAHPLPHQTQYLYFLHAEELKNFALDLREFLFPLQQPEKNSLGDTLIQLDVEIANLERIALSLCQITQLAINHLQELMADFSSPKLREQLRPAIVPGPHWPIFRFLLPQEKIQIDYPLLTTVGALNLETFKEAITDLTQLQLVARTQQLAARKIIDHLTKIHLHNYALYFPDYPLTNHPQEQQLLVTLAELIFEVVKNAVKNDYH